MYLQTTLFFLLSFFLSFFFGVFHCLCSTSSKTTRIVQQMWCFALPQCASDSTFEHRKAGTTQHCRGNHFFVFLVYGRNKQDDVGLVSTSRRLYFGEASLQSPGACTSKSIQYYFLYNYVDLDLARRWLFSTSLLLMEIYHL